MAYLTQAALEAMGFAHLGADIQISERASIYNPERISLGDHTRIDDFCVVSGNVSLGRNVHLAVHCNVAGGTPGIRMADFSGLAYGCQVFAQSDDYSGRTMTNPTVPTAFKHEILAPVEIGRHAILGAGTIVFPGVVIGEGVATGAHSTVVRSLEPWGIYLGSPAKLVKERDRGLLEYEQRYLAGEHTRTG